MKRLFTVLLAVLLGLGGSYFAWHFFLQPQNVTNDQHPFGGMLSHAERVNYRFTKDPATIDILPPRLRLIRVPDFPGVQALWGATGRDSKGHIWFGVSAYGNDLQSAHLFEYDPILDLLTDRGDVISDLKKINLYTPGKQQPKIHTKIIEAGDGHLYFCTMDEPRPGEVGERTPPHGSHWWRLRMPERNWEHLYQTDVGLIAMTGGGGYLYALAFPDHQLLQFDLKTEKVKKFTVGSVEGHISRNIVVDGRGHAYVPRLRMIRSGHAEHTLVEFDTRLVEVNSWPLPHYQHGEANQCHGITAYQHLPDQSFVFLTHPGRLFRIRPGDGAQSLTDLGWFHPEGKAYSASLFTYLGVRYFVGASYRQWDQKSKHDWICFDMNTRKSTKLALKIPLPMQWSDEDALLYGCNTIDDQGRVYVVGALVKEGKRVPVILQVSSLN